MIAASEEFLRNFHLRDGRGAVDQRDLHIRAVMAGHSLLDFADGSVAAVDFDTALLAASIQQLRYAGLPRAGWYTSPDPRETQELFDRGLPFVGWAIGAENRRIKGVAQLGEGDFIKHLGRDVA